MGLVTGKLILKNPRIPDLEPLEITALADTGAVHYMYSDLCAFTT